MARITKSLVPPEQGYSHRDHRSKKGRIQGYWYKKKVKRRMSVLKQEEFHDPELKPLIKRKALRKPKLTS